MAIFQCSIYPQLRVVDPRRTTRYLAKFKDGLFETEDPDTIVILSKCNYVCRIDAPKKGQDHEQPIAEEHQLQQQLPPLPKVDASEVLLSLVNEALERGVLTKRGRYIYHNRTKVGDSVLNAAHNLRFRPRLAKNIAKKMDAVRAGTSGADSVLRQ